MTETIPTWHKQALQQGIDYIILVYGKAEGLAFCPSNLEKPFRVGGDYDGNWPTDAKGALYHFERFFNKAFLDRVQWFIPYIKKVESGVDFSLNDLKIEQRKLRVIHGRWPW